MSNTTTLKNRTSTIRQIAIATVIACCALPMQAHAVAPAFAAGTSVFVTDLLAILAPIFGIAIIGCGVAAWFGKISWNWIIGLIVGAIFVFGNQQIVTWIRGAFLI